MAVEGTVDALVALFYGSVGAVVDALTDEGGGDFD